MIKSKVLQKINDKKTISNNIVLSILLVTSTLLVKSPSTLSIALYPSSLYSSL